MYCKKCGYALDDSFNVCPHCGTAKGEGEEFCGNCGKQRTAGNMFCSGCGFNFATGVSQQPASVQKNVYSPPAAAPVPANAPQPNMPNYQNGFDFKSYAKEFGNSIVSTVKSPDRLKLILRHGSFAAAILIFIIMLFPVVEITASAPLVGSYSTSFNMFTLSGFGALLFVLSLIVSLLKFEPHVISTLNSNKFLEPYSFLVAPLLQLLGFLCMLIKLSYAASYLDKSLGSYSAYIDSSAHFTFGGWLITLLVIASVAASVYGFIKYDLASVKADFKPKQNPNQQGETITDAFNANTFNNTVYYGNDINNNSDNNNKN